MVLAVTRGTFVSALLIVTSASGITAPVESVTIPVILPVPICAATGLATTLNLRAALSWLSRQISAALGTAWWPFTAVARYAMPKQISGWWLQIVHEHTVVDDTPKDDDKA